MQQLNLSSLRSSGTSRDVTRADAELQQFQRAFITCPHCEMQCQPAGKMRNSWYTFCKCGTYTQLCDSVNEYCD